MSIAHSNGSEPTARKPHRDWAGYICERRNPLTGDHNVVVLAEDAHLDAAGGRYAVICNAHSVLINVTNLPKARECMRDSTEFCEACRSKAEGA